MSDWTTVLRARCAETSQADVARRIGYSPAVVSGILKGTYRGNSSAVEAAFRGVFMGQTVACPVLGEIPPKACAEHQGRPFGAANPIHTELYRACRGGCPHSKIARPDRC